MSGRHVLVIGSRCTASPTLSFLPRLANELHPVLTDPTLGQCEPALPDQPGPLLDLSMPALMKGLERAVTGATSCEAALFVAFIGHGRISLDNPSSDYYLLPYDCPTPQQPGMYTAWLIGQELPELLARHDRLDGNAKHSR